MTVSTFKTVTGMLLVVPEVYEPAPGQVSTCSAHMVADICVTRLRILVVARVVPMMVSMCTSIHQHYM